ncbi:MAG: hypothetical protein U1F43_37375 [Myxococcota bacterium]
MAAGIVLMDLIWAAGLIGLTTLSAASFLAVMQAMPGALGLALGLGAAMLAWVLACAALLFLLPRPKPGKYQIMRGPGFYAWAVGFIVWRWVELPPMGLIYRQSALLRFLVMRAAGARLSFTATMSSDATVLDPALFTMGPGAMLGSKSTVASHFILGDRLILAPVVIHPGAQIAIDVVIGPGAIIGRKAIIEARASIGPESQIGDEAVVGGGVAMGRAVTVGRRARIPMASVVPYQSRIPDGGTWPLARRLRRPRLRRSRPPPRWRRPPRPDAASTARRGGGTTEPWTPAPIGTSSPTTRTPRARSTRCASASSRPAATTRASAASSSTSRRSRRSTRGPATRASPRPSPPPSTRARAPSSTSRAWPRPRPSAPPAR